MSDLYIIINSNFKLFTNSVYFNINNGKNMAYYI